LNNGGSGLFSWIQNGITWANEAAKRHISDGDFVIYSFSLGASSGNQGITDALNAAAAQGVLIVAAAGNTGGRGVNFPGNVISAKAIAALQKKGLFERFWGALMSS
jgi:subtilisin family serine protease